MSNHIDKHSIQKTLDQICAHPYFEKSPRNLRLLRFLVQQAIDGIDVKEHTIGLELFNDRFDPNNNDAKVRVYMFNLRKKLKEYYASYGHRDAIIFTIEKGQYNISFSYKELRSTLVFRKIKNKKVITLVTVLTLITIGVIYFIPKTEYYCWNDFFTSDSTTICVIADHYFVDELKPDRKWYATRIPTINNDEDLFNHVKENNTQELRDANYTLLSKMAPFAVLNLSVWFNQYKRKFSLSLESEFRFEDTRTNNIIYVGQFKTMNASKGIFLQGSKVFSVYKDGFRYKHNEVEKEYITSIDNQNRIEYAMVSYIKLENGKKALYFTSNHDIGTMATVRNFTNYNWLKSFYKDLPKDTKHFNALFKVTGLERTEMSCEMIHLEILDVN